MEKNSPNLLVGYTTRKHLLIDLDNTQLQKVVLLVLMIQEYYRKVGDCLIVLSSLGSHKQHIRYSKLGRAKIERSLNNYHLVFDAMIGYNSCCRIISTLASLRVLNRDYVKIRSFRGDMTLRITPNIDRHEITPFPQPLGYVGMRHEYRRGGYIRRYLSQLKNAYYLFKGEHHYFSVQDLPQLYPPLSKRLHPLPR